MVFGEIQAIGGVNEKIEGFFEICKLKGLTGKQGVMIPPSNVKNLMLKQEVLTAVENDEFHVWSVETIEDGIEVLTGKKAGGIIKDDSFEPDSIFDRADQRLNQIADDMAKFSK
jgi:predicted ATP-dependent protease